MSKKPKHKFHHYVFNRTVGRGVTRKACTLRDLHASHEAFYELAVAVKRKGCDFDLNPKFLYWAHMAVFLTDAVNDVQEGWGAC